MENTIEVRCSQCNTVKNIPKPKLAAYWNKSIHVACDSCSGQTKLRVDASLFNQGMGKPQTGHTIVLDKKAEKSGKTVKVGQLSVISNDKTEVQLVELKEGVNLIGRAAASDNNPDKRSIVTSDMTMSRYHCVISVQKSQDSWSYIISDEGSVNGTFLNHSDSPLSENEESYIEMNDIISLGDTQVKLIQ